MYNQWCWQAREMRLNVIFWLAMLYILFNRITHWTTSVIFWLAVLYYSTESPIVPDQGRRMIPRSGHKTNHYPILLSFIWDFPFLDHPPSTIQVLKLSSIDSGSAGSGFEVKLYGFLVGFHGFGSFKYFGCLFYIDVLMWRYQSKVLGLYLAFISHVKIHFLYISCRMRFVH